MKKKGSFIADEIMCDYYRAQRAKERAERIKEHKKDKQKENTKE